MDSEKHEIYVTQILTNLCKTGMDNQAMFSVLSSCLVSFIVTLAHEDFMDPLALHAMHTKALSNSLSCIGSIDPSVREHVQQIKIWMEEDGKQ